MTFHGFPIFCGAVVGGYTILQIPFRILLRWVALQLRGKSPLIRRGVSDILPRFFAAFFSAWLSLGLLNDEQFKAKQATEVAKTSSVERDDCEITQQLALEPVPLAGSSMDMTLFAASRAAETIIHRVWLSRKKSRIANGKWTVLEGVITQYADSWVFAASTGAIMWAWFYLPNSLPRAYNAWIKSAAQVDQRLVEVLRRARRGDFVYGENTGQAPILQSMCKDYDWPLVWGDPAKTVPLPCEMVHMGTG